MHRSRSHAPRGNALPGRSAARPNAPDAPQSGSYLRSLRISTPDSFVVAPTSQSPTVPYEGPQILLADEEHSYLYWEVREPKQGQVYQLHWAW